MGMTNSKIGPIGLKHILLIIAFISVYSSHAPAAVEEQRYVGFQYSLVTYDEDGDEAEPTALIARYGQFLNDRFAFEGRIGFGLEDDSLEVGSLDIDVEVENIFGVYGAFHTGSISIVSLYGIIGYTHIKLEGSAHGIAIDEIANGLSYGLGVNIGSLSIEYMDYIEDHYYEVTAISLGYIYRF